MESYLNVHARSEWMASQYLLRLAIRLLGYWNAYAKENVTCKITVSFSRKSHSIQHFSICARKIQSMFLFLALNGAINMKDYLIREAQNTQLHVLSCYKKRCKMLISHKENK